MAGNDAGLIADRPTTHNAALHQLSLRTLTVSFFLLVLYVVVDPARANQVPTSSAGAGPVVKTYPASALTMTMAISGNTTISVADGVLNGFGGVVSSQLSPPVPPASKGLQILAGAVGCNATVAICSNRGTMTLTFSRAVTNPVLHLSGLGGSRTLGANTTNFGKSICHYGRDGADNFTDFYFAQWQYQFFVDFYYHSRCNSCEWRRDLRHCASSGLRQCSNQRDRDFGYHSHRSGDKRQHDQR